MFTIGTWRPVMGDTSLAGWISVYLYGACALLAFFIALVKKSSPLTKNSASFYLIYACFFLVLTLIKRFDLLSGITALIRVTLQSLQAMNIKRIVQACVMLIIGIAFIYVAVKKRDTILLLANPMMRNLIVLFAFIVIFVLFRSISLHQFETLIGIRIFGKIRLNSIYEIAFLSCVLLHLMIQVYFDLRSILNTGS